jgi:hypothetical protein
LIWRCDRFIAWLLRLSRIAHGLHTNESMVAEQDNLALAVLGAEKTPESVTVRTICFECEPSS